jgi:hypothetical protein
MAAAVNAFFDLTVQPLLARGSFENLDSVHVFDTFRGFRAGPGSFSVDNLVVNTAAVPEPASLLLLGSDLVAAGLPARAKPELTPEPSAGFFFDGDDAESGQPTTWNPERSPGCRSWRSSDALARCKRT